MGIVLRKNGLCMVVGILVMLFCSGRCEMVIAAPCNGTIGHCHKGNVTFVDAAEIDGMYGFEEFAMESEISSRFLAEKINYKPLKQYRPAKSPAPKGKSYTRPCTYANKCRH